MSAPAVRNRARLGAPLAVVIAAAVLVATAGADVVVRAAPASTPQITIAVEPSSSSASHRFSIQAFEDGGRAGVRLQQLGGGDPTIRSPTNAFCFTNVFANDVVCDEVDPRAGATITMGDGNDTVRFVGAEGDFGAGAIVIDGILSTPGLPGRLACTRDRQLSTVTVTLGPGNDTLAVDNAAGNPECPDDTVAFLVRRGIPFELDPVLTVSAGGGADTIAGGIGDDTIRGNSGNDVIETRGGDDNLQGDAGNDVLRGQFGSDTLTGGPGNDTLQGLGGNDVFQMDVDDRQGTDGADTYDGGGGRDVVRYGFRTVPLEVTIDGGGPDGAAGENDNVVDVEVVFGGTAGDRIVGTGADERLVGNLGRDTLIGRDGEDALEGGSGDDFLNAVDGDDDTVDCGGGFDRATVDLRDTLSGCELVARFPADDSPPGYPAGRRVALSPSGAVVSFVCPRSSRPRCRGILRLRDPRSQRVLGRASYAFARGGRGAVRVPLSRAEARLLRGRGRVVVETVERGHSRIGPRGVRFLLRVTRSA